MADSLDTSNMEKTVLSQENSPGDMPTMPTMPIMNMDDKSIGRVDRYDLIEKLGEGGFGAVYGARDTESGILVALKALPAEISCDAGEMVAIRKNFALVSRLSHPNIAGLKHLHKVESPCATTREVLGIKAGDYLVVMEYAPGITLSALRRVLPDEKMPFDQALDICRQIAAAIDYAHSQRILHRDIKPGNVMVGEKQLGSSQGTNLVKVLDFGLAAEIRSAMTRVSISVQSAQRGTGTPRYMPPEQWAGEPQNERVDQYSLAAMLYELVSGAAPFKSAFDSGDFRVMFVAVSNNTVKPLEDLTRKQNADIRRALSKNPEDRFGSCSEFIRALEVDSSAFSWSAVSGRGALRKNTKKRKALAAVAGVIALVGLSIGVGLLLKHNKSEPDQPQSTEDVQPAGSAPKSASSSDAADQSLRAEKILFDDAENVATLALRSDAELKMTLEQAVAVKSQVELCFQQATADPDRSWLQGQVSEQQIKMGIAKSYFEVREYGKAVTAYHQVFLQCGKWNELEKARNLAFSKKQALVVQVDRLKQEEVPLYAPEHWKRVSAELQQVEILFGNSDYLTIPDAIDTVQLHLTEAEQFAAGTQQVNVAKKAYEAQELSVNLTALRQFEQQKYANIQALCKQAETFAKSEQWANSVQNWQQAIRSLSAAEQSALEKTTAHENVTQELERLRKAWIVSVDAAATTYCQTYSQMNYETALDFAQKAKTATNQELAAQWYRKALAAMKAAGEETASVLNKRMNASRIAYEEQRAALYLKKAEAFAPNELKIMQTAQKVAEASLGTGTMKELDAAKIRYEEATQAAESVALVMQRNFSTEKQNKYTEAEKAFREKNRQGAIAPVQAYIVFAKQWHANPPPEWSVFLENIEGGDRLFGEAEALYKQGRYMESSRRLAGSQLLLEAAGVHEGRVADLEKKIEAVHREAAKRSKVLLAELEKLEQQVHRIAGAFEAKEGFTKKAEKQVNAKISELLNKAQVKDEEADGLVLSLIKRIRTFVSEHMVGDSSIEVIPF